MSTDTAKAIVTSRDLTVKFDRGVRKISSLLYPTLCDIVQSTGADEKHAGLGGVPQPREWLGDRQFKELAGAHFTIENKLYESSLLIKKTDIQDDRLGLYDRPLEQLGAEAAVYPDHLLMSLIAAGYATACYDGQYFFDTDHSEGNSGSQSNDLTYNASSHTAVTPVEFRAAYHQALIAMAGFLNDQGLPIHGTVLENTKGLVVLVPLALKHAAVKGLTASLLDGGDSNLVLDAPRIIASPLLTSGVEWYLFKTDMARPFIFQAREPLSRQTKGWDDLETKDIKFMTQARYNLGYGNWQSAVMTTFN